ncbi:unnamed protein product [Didymodactylos carnosus]|uniref:Large ribosomal subunit protein mL52 n=1 Tax=Didymodactylos carnosus TaxID=1234261 RepID=A0A814I9F1_9BILA|nr:unnamed protein product [Didymodactylos carnosus]CAF1021388.1 unnamed protein product [Didymodactylos carnosus]CAF3614883.1 unnamed protein product [Didymodactylos carnosus]CAF3792798.1 unnamed protein product [Didymodactylos carnosus]
MLSRLCFIQSRSFSVTCVYLLPNRYWRIENKLPKHDSQYGPLTDLPDYSYLDGQPTPMNGKTRRRLEWNKTIVHRIHELDAELKAAQDKYAQKIQQAVDEYSNVVEISTRLKSPQLSAEKKWEKENILDTVPRPSIIYPNRNSAQPHMLNALKDATTYNEAFEEVIDPVGKIVPNHLANTKRPNSKINDRRKWHSPTKVRGRKVYMFPR